jgi:hypothetical protein
LTGTLFEAKQKTYTENCVREYKIFMRKEEWMMMGKQRKRAFGKHKRGLLPFWRRDPLVVEESVSQSASSYNRERKKGGGLLYF